MSVKAEKYLPYSKQLNVNTYFPFLNIILPIYKVTSLFLTIPFNPVPYQTTLYVMLLQTIPPNISNIFPFQTLSSHKQNRTDTTTIGKTSIKRVKVSQHTCMVHPYAGSPYTPWHDPIHVPRSTEYASIMPGPHDLTSHSRVLGQYHNSAALSLSLRRIRNVLIDRWVAIWAARCLAILTRQQEMKPWSLVEDQHQE